MGTGFQGRRSNKKSFLLSSCSSWVIAALSSLWFIQASSLRAMEPEEPVRRSVKSGGKKDSVNSNGFYKDSEHPQTAEFWKTKDLSKRLEKIKLCISEIQEKITNYKTNEINITSEEIEKYKNFFKCNQSDPIFIQDLGDITFDNLLWESDPTHTMAGGWSAAKVAVLKCENSKIKIAIKKFQTKDLKIGLEELLYSLIALNINPSPEEIKMARIWDAAITCENSNECLNIIMECANGEDIHKILSKDSSSTNFSSNAIKACAEYLAIFHIRNYEKLNKETNREKYLLYAAKPFNTLVYDPLKGDENKSLFPLFVKKPLSEIDEQLSDFEQIKPDHVLRLLSPDDQEKFIYFAKRSRDQFEENASEIYRAIQCWGMQKEKSYFLTLTHGDAHGNNFFYDDNKNLTHKGKDIPKDSFYRVAMIDFASSIKTYGDIGDPAEDVGRFLGSLWDWAAKQDGPLCEHYEKIWNLQEQFIQFYMKKIEASGIFKEKNKKIFERVFKENYNFYKLRFYKIIANAKKDQESEKDKDIKKKVLEYWIKENAALDSSFQEKPKKIIVRKESKERDWEPAPTVQKKSIHFIPQESTVFIESADEEGSYLTRLWGMLRDKRNVTLSSRAAIAGMGGVGKTSLALEYAHEAFRNRAYNLIYWIPCGSELSLINGYKNLLLEMGIPIKNVDNERLIDLVKWKVPKWGKCLLIYDNVTDPSLLTGIIPQENTHILITSRCSEGWEKPALNLNVFRPEDSINYLLKVTGLNKIPENEKVAGELADELAHLPLALALAAHYIKLVGGQNASAEHFRDYLKALKEEIKKGSLIHFEEKRNLFKEPESKITYENLINRTLRISSGRLSDLAKKLMEYSAYLDSDSISKEIFLESSSSKKQVEEALTQLSSLSLIKRMHNEPLFSIHRLVQLVIRNENELKDDKKPQEIFSFMTSTFKILFEKNIKTSEQIDKLLTYLPHIIELLTHSQRLKIVSDELSYLGWIGKILDFIEWENITEILFKFNISTKTLVKDKKYINKKKHQLLKKAHFLFSDFISSFDLPNRIIQIAEQNHPRIQWVLAEISEDKKFYWLTKSAERGYAKAQCSLGSLYKDGAQIEKNYEKTVQSRPVATRLRRHW